MKNSLIQLSRVQSLVDTGRHAEALEFIRAQPEDELQNSPTLALLYGIALGRLGQLVEAERWAEVALHRARERGDRSIEARSLNVCGAIAFERGRIEAAADYFQLALAEAEREQEHAAVGRCSNNLGIIANLRGEYGKAVSSYTMALAAFQKAGHARGLAEAQHNLAITYRDKGDLVRGMEAADRAVRQTESFGDLALRGQTFAGRAEIRLRTGAAELARREVELALQTHRQVGDVVGESEDLRVLAAVHIGMNDWDEAERLLGEVIERAETHGRPLLAAMAERDLAHLLQASRRTKEAKEVAGRAIDRFRRLGASADVRKLEGFTENRGRK